jgi:hypothetical protein
MSLPADAADSQMAADAAAAAEAMLPPATGYTDPHGLRGLGTGAGRGFFVTSLVFLILAFVAVGMRLWSKRVLRRDFKLHDHFMFLGLVCYSITTTFLRTS